MRSFYSKGKHCLLEKERALENPTLMQLGYRNRLLWAVGGHHLADYANLNLLQFNSIKF
ncbi:hypothetical protein SAMN05444062_102191 [Pseudomonas syringae]|nr:hypothetical protein SAMN05444062_102191 [Pseudomonas syringae]